MLYIFAGTKLILYNRKFIWRLLRMFSTQIWEKVDCEMKSRFFVNICNMHAWPTARDISNVMSPLLLSACSTISHTQPFPWHMHKLGQMHTQHFRRLWADQAPTYSLALVDLDGIAFQIWYPIGKSAEWIFLYHLWRICIFLWFSMFLEELAVAACSYRPAFLDSLRSS